MEQINKQTFQQKLKSYRKSPLSLTLFLLVTISALVTAFVLFFLIAYILIKGVPHLTLDLFSWTYNSENVSMLPSIVNTFLMTLLSLLIATPLGIFSAIYLVEYAKRGSKVVKIVRITAETLSGIPSIVYGLFGMLFFVVTLHWGYSILSGAFTLAIMILPLIMRTTEEALKSVPDTYREGSFGLGAGRLPNRIPYCTAVSCSWYFGRRYFGHWAHCRRNSCIDFHSGYSSGNSRESARFGAYPFGTYV